MQITQTKKNYSKLQITVVNNSLLLLTIVNFTSEQWNYRTLIYYKKKLWYYRQNYGTMAKTMVLYRELLKFDLQRKENDRLPKTKKT